MIRSTPVYIQGKDGAIVLDCATGGDSTSGGNLNGNIIDLNALPQRFTHLQGAIAGSLPGSTSTAGGRRVSLEVRIQHGDSSGGGDMANLSTDMLPDSAVNFYSTAQTTDEKAWSTGTIRYQYNTPPIPLLPAGRFVRVQGVVTRIGAATSTAAGQIFSCHLAALGINAGSEPAWKTSFNPSGDHVGTERALTTSTAT